MSDAVLHQDLPSLSTGNLKRIRSLHVKKYRDAEGAFLAEGVRLCEEALASQVTIERVICTERALENSRISNLVSRCLEQKIPVLRTTSKKFDALSEEQSPQGIAFVVQKLNPQGEILKGKFIVAIDALQDPGNLGTILRSAEWFGISSIVLGQGTVDVYNPKVVRASMGAIFRQIIVQDVELVAFLADCKKNGWRVLGASAAGHSLLPDIVATERDVFVIGNEGGGLSPRVSKMLDTSVSIPGCQKGESLNAAVAASIFMYHLSQQNTKSAANG